MKAFAALYVAPEVETNYQGYQRQEIDYVDQYFLKPIGITFPCNNYGDISGIKYVGIISESGEILCATELSNELKAKMGEQLLVLLFCNLPADLNPIVKKIYQLWAMGEIKAEDLHPQLYEAVNNELHAAGIPVIPVIRSGTAKLIGKISNMPSLRDMGVEGVA